MLLIALALISAAPELCRAAPSLSDTLGFEVPGPDGMIAGWQGGPPGTIALDSLVVRGGRFTLRFLRDASSREEYSYVARMLPVTFTGDSLELRGWLRTDSVSDYAGLWLREEGSRGQLVLGSMENRHVSGTTPWTEFRVSLPLHRKANFISFGALLSGKGTAHVDNLELLVNGQEPSKAPRLVRAPTAIETDHEFDGGSRITATRFKQAQVEKLALLAKVWGFVKYHHPRATSAALNWDYELFRILPSVMGITRRGEAESLITRWLDRVGEPEAPDLPATLPDSAQSRPRIDWIHGRAKLGKDLSARLERIYARRDADEEQYYVALAGVVPDFSNEASYAGDPLPDAGYRLLALFRFWNIIEYWSPYRDLIREDWDGVLREFIPRVMGARTQDEYRLEMMAFIARVGDGHSNLWSSLDVRPPRGGCQLPVAVRVAEGKFVVGAYADSVLGPASGLRIGDVIQKLDGAPVDSLARAYAPYYGASNETGRMRDIARSLTRGPCGPCRIEGDRSGGAFELTAARDSVRIMDWSAGTTHDLRGGTFRLLEKDVAYLKLSSLAAADASDHVRAAAGTRCLVIDIRGYPKEYSVFALGQHLVTTPTEFVRFTHGDLTNPGAFFWSPPISLRPEEPRYAGQIVILADEMSMSRAEYTAMAFRAAPNSLVVGSTTAGSDGEIARVPLPGGLRTWITGIGVFYPDKTPTQRVGIIPDLDVRPTLEAIRSGRDEVLEAALKHVLGRTVIIRP